MREIEWREQSDGSYWLVDKDAPDDLTADGYLYAPDLIADIKYSGTDISCVDLRRYMNGFPDEHRSFEYLHVCKIDEMIDSLTQLKTIYDSLPKSTGLD